MALIGGPQLMAKLEAIKHVAAPVGHDWGDETVRLARPVRTRTR